MIQKNKKTVLVGLSGGVDSSVALAILKKQGLKPIGVSFRHSVCSENNFAIAKKICQKLKVPYHIIDARLDFNEKVIGYFLSELKDNRTPSPCLICNRFVKFQGLFDFARAEGIEYVATGHYARIKKNEKTGEYELLKGVDKMKDQSYFLSLLEQEQLGKIIFPLGEYTKKEVYQIAAQEGFKFFSEIKQSQDLCFVGKKALPFYLDEKLGVQPGDIVDKKGNVLGRHKGLFHYTIGQRKGMNISGGPWRVVDLDKKKNRIIITNKENDPALFRKTISLARCHFISGVKPKGEIKVMAKIRFNQKASRARLSVVGNKAKLIFEKPQKAATPGQFAVFYKGSVCLGGGAINL
ncbi:MAG: tRNA 2-thiouridine(34) synthase MnmA [Candidatus Portnoybacteria bacterium]|nr:tRNA 2-thiouridine(34) synthase MnmA [Candidatus Portnoybacteria bacterium]